MFAKGIVTGLAAWVCCAGIAQAVTIDLVPVGNPGNPNETTGYGSVAQRYLIGKYEVTNAQWREFLTAKASVSDPYGLYNMNMAGTFGRIDRTGSEGHYVYTAKGGDAN
jgi:formylglycine-generating enzyme